MFTQSLFSTKFEKRRAIRASVGGVGGVLAWVMCQRVWHGQHACVGRYTYWEILAQLRIQNKP